MKAKISYKIGTAGESLPTEAISKLQGHDGPISCVTFSQDDGKYCLTGGYDRTVRLWNPLRLDPAHPPPKISHHHLNKNGGDNDIAWEDLPRALPIHVYSDGVTHPVTAVAVDSTSTTLVSASEKTCVVHDVVTGQCKRRLQGHTGRINAVATIDNAETYLSASYDASVRIWDGRSRSFEPIQILKEAKDSVTSLHTVQQPDNSIAIIRTASVDGVVRTYDLRMGLLQCDDVSSPITGMCPTTSDQRGLVVVNCLDGALRLLDLDQGRLLKHYADSHQAGQYSLNCAFSANDDYVMTGSEDGSAVIYDINKGTVCQVLEGQRQPTCAVAMHPRLEFASAAITASFDGTAVVWGNDASLMQWQE